MKALGLYGQYDYSRPRSANMVKQINTMQGIKQVFSNPAKYKVPYTRDMNVSPLFDDHFFLFISYPVLDRQYCNAGMFLIYDDAERHDHDRALAMHALFPDHEAMGRYRQYYRDQTKFFLKTKSFKLSLPNGSPRYVDIVQNVINMTSVHWACNQLCGISLKTTENPRGVFTE